MLEVVRLTKEQWLPFAEAAHFDAFERENLEEARRFDFAVLAKIEGQDLAFFTVKELDKDSAFILYGGIFTEFRGGKHGYKGFHAMIEDLKKSYMHIGFATKTKNIPMLKLGLNEGFEIVGLRQINRVPYVELLLGGN